MTLEHGPVHVFVRSTYIFVTSFLLLTVACLAMFLVSLFTLFRARRFCQETIAKSLGHAVLRVSRIELVEHREQALPAGQYVYVANHSSSLDLFILIALGLPDTRFFMKRKFLLVLPLGVMAGLIGTFFTPPQSMPEKRRRCFQRAERVLRKSGQSVFLSPEGTRVTDGRIGPFNRGAFHLATDLRAPLVPLFIDVPREVNPGKGLFAEPGKVDVYVGAPIPTTSWSLDEVDANKTRVRELFVDRVFEYRKCRESGDTPVVAGHG